MENKGVSSKLELAKLELDVAFNIFNEATGDLVDPAIERYNKALKDYNLVKEEGDKQ